MRKAIFTLVCSLAAILLYPRVFSFVYRAVPVKWWTERIAYGQVKDIYHPTTDDYRAIQKYLSKGRRPELTKLGDMQKTVRKLRIIGKRMGEAPQFGKVAVNCAEDERENCLLIYASFHRGAPKKVQGLIETISKSDFKGHILYRIGGWPNVEEGDLTKAHVPYAYKTCFFREAKRLGYQHVDWFDVNLENAEWAKI